MSILFLFECVGFWCRIFLRKSTRWFPTELTGPTRPLDAFLKAVTPLGGAPRASENGGWNKGSQRGNGEPRRCAEIDSSRE